MICRKDTLGHIDFMRGKYNVTNKPYILNMLNQMTEELAVVLGSNYNDMRNKVLRALKKN